jgi:predicted permease
MNNIVLLFLCLLLGIALRVMRKFPDNAHLSLNSFIIHISLPALIIVQIHHVSLRFKLLLAPAVLALLYSGILGRTEEITRVTLFEAAMGPQIGGAIVAIQHGLNPPLVSLMVGLGISLPFLTLPLWSYVLHQL